MAERRLVAVEGARVMDARLVDIARALEATGWAAELYDARWRLVWVSSQLKQLVGEEDDEALGVGLHLLESRLQDVWSHIVPARGMAAWIRETLPPILVDDPGIRDVVLAHTDKPEVRDVVEAAEPAEAPVWSGQFSVLLDEGEDRVRYFGVRLREADGVSIGAAYVYGSALPATLLALVARGDAGMFERMARLMHPGRQEAAILFADLQASGALSRRLPSAAYFEVIRDLDTRIDEAVIGQLGIVGKHVGDGVVAFFLPHDVGSPSKAARAAVLAARGVRAAAAEIGAEHGVELAVNVGLHWGGMLYMGQIVTRGRLEVTALGDEVNECARIEQVARDGALLASKELLERLDPEDAEAAGVDTDRVIYTALAELAADDQAKVLRDAGQLAVTALR
jgi:class 3 adenylate cyclase